MERHSLVFHPAMIMMMADGKGDRVTLLTEHRSQTGRSFAMTDRPVDFVLGNSGIHPVSVTGHILTSWDRTLVTRVAPERATFPSRFRIRTGWYEGIPEAAHHADDLHLPHRAEVSVPPWLISVDPASRSRLFQRAICIDRAAPEAL